MLGYWVVKVRRGEGSAFFFVIWNVFDCGGGGCLFVLAYLILFWMMVVEVGFFRELGRIVSSIVIVFFKDF